jgi:hypothetical protein
MTGLHARAPSAASLLLLLALVITPFERTLAETVGTWKCLGDWNVAGWDSCRTCKPRYFLTGTLTECKAACETGAYVGLNTSGPTVFVDRRDCTFVVYNMKGECWLKNSWNNGGNGRTQKEYGTIACRKVG